MDVKESILNSVKAILGIQAESTDFDAELILHINSVFFILSQLGIGPKEPFIISSEENLWSDYLGEDKSLEAVKNYVALKVKLMFDPPQSSAVMESTKRMIDELEFRLQSTTFVKQEDKDV